ncbi:MAG: hypothetical protein RR388_03880 [Rikenellaceae bacterium]
MKRIKLLFTTAIAICAVSVASAQTAAEVTEKFNAAAEKFNAKDFVSAIPLFVETISMAEKSGEDVAETLQNSQKFLINSYLNAGIADAQKGKFDEALNMFLDADKLATSTSSPMKAKAKAMVANIYVAKGTAFVKAKQLAEAADMFNKAYLENDKNTKNALLAAQYYGEAGNAEKATEIYKAIIALGASNAKYASAATEAKAAFASSYLVAAVKATTDNNYAEVTANLDKIAEIDPQNAQASMLRIQAANNMKKFDDVIKYADAAAAAQTTPDAKSNVYFFLGAAYQSKENKAKAIENYTKVTAGENVATAKSMITALSK